MKRFIALLALGFAATCGVPFTAQAQTNSLKFYVEQGDSLLQSGLYAEAYKVYDYFLKNATTEDRQSAIYTTCQQKRSKAYVGIESVNKDLYKKAEALTKLGKFEEAYPLYESYLQNCVTPEFQRTYPYTVALKEKALYLQGKGKMQESLDLLYKSAQIREKADHIDFVHAAEIYNLIASAYSQQGQYDQAIEQCEKAVDLYAKRYGKKNENYATTLSNLASYYTSRNAPGDREHAVKLGEEAVNSLSKDNPAYAHVVNNLVLHYSLSGDKVKAQKYAQDAKKTKTKKLDQNSLNYASVLSNQAVHLANSSNYVEAAKLAKEAIAIFEQLNETQSLNFARLLANTASFEKHNEHYPEAIKLWERAAAIYEKIQTKNGSNYLDCISEVSAAYAKMGNLEQAANINEQLMANDQQGAKDDVHQAQSFAKRASILSREGDYRQAIVLESKALEVFRFRKELADEASSLSDISNYLYHLGKLDEAVDTCQVALDIYKKVAGHDEDKALVLNNLSIYYSSQGKYEEALQASKKAVQHFESANRTESSLFTKVLTNMALYEAMRDSLNEAIAISCKADSIQKRLLGSQHPDNVMLTFNRAVYHVRNGDTIEGQRLFHQAMSQQMNHVRSNFSHLTTREREMYWGTKRYVFHYAPYVACLIANNDSALVDAYNSLLFTKGILLNSEVDFRNLLSRTANEDIQDKYAELEAIRQQIDGIYRKQTAENDAQIKQLNKDANRLERELARNSKEFGDFTAAMNIDVDQVKKALPEDGAAIEFFDIETRQGERSYWALLVRRNDQVPHLVRLFNESELDEFAYGKSTLRDALMDYSGIDSIYNNQEVGKLIWEPIMPYLQGLHAVWFSPSGLFYQFGIEYLNYDGNRLSDLFTLHRVSSTKQIVGNGAASKMVASNHSHQLSDVIKRADIFGGLDYDASPQQLQAANDKRGKMSHEHLDAFNAQMADLAMADQEDLGQKTRDAFARAGLKKAEYLEAAAEETWAINGILFEQGIEHDTYEKEYGTEEVFKSLSDNCPTLLHIATHGFALSEDEAQKNMADLAFLGMREDAANQADNSLCYAGLLLAGANNTLDPEKRKKMPENMEDGILTAREIARMNMCGLELVILSACQTGCGILQDDGVFGLQRGFKKAGAHTLLMSLWSVDDRATKKMMTAFYEELARGTSRRAAFHAAQNSLRADPEFSKPRYWAAFIMLDD